MEPEVYKKKLHIRALIVVIVLVLILFKVNVEKAVNSPQFESNTTYIEKEATILFIKIKGLFNFSIPLNFNQKAIEDKVQPGKIYDYFGVPSDKILDNLSSPNGN